MRYLLPCPCGESIAISPSQAGGAVECPHCGQRVEAPRLRELRELPVDETAAPTSGSSWGFRQGLLSLGLMLAAVLAAGGQWFAWRAPEPPQPFDAQERLETVERGMETMSPTQLWALFVEVYEPATRSGLRRMEAPADQIALAQIEFCEKYRDRFWMAAGVVVAATLVAYAVLPRS